MYSLYNVCIVSVDKYKNCEPLAAFSNSNTAVVDPLFNLDGGKKNAALCFDMLF